MDEKSLKKRIKAVLVLGEIDAGNDNFTVTISNGLVDDFDCLFDGKGPVGGAFSGDDTVTAAVGAAGLDFEKEAAAVGKLVPYPGGVGKMGC